jgi:large subunit ribosomal protein L49
MFRYATRAAGALRCATSSVSSTLRSAPLPTTQKRTLVSKDLLAIVNRSKKKPDEPKLVLPEQSPVTENLSYHVGRSPSAYLPVYRRPVNGDTRARVVVKRIEGDRLKAMEDMITLINIPREKVRLNPTNQQIEVHGDYYEKIKKWLVWCGF